MYTCSFFCKGSHSQLTIQQDALSLQVLLDLAIDKVFTLLHCEDWDSLAKSPSASCVSVRKYIYDTLRALPNPKHHLSWELVAFLFSQNCIRAAGNNEAHTASKSDVSGAVVRFDPPEDIPDAKRILEAVYFFEYEERAVRSGFSF
jgi:hypothetical protein